MNAAHAQDPGADINTPNRVNKELGIFANLDYRARVFCARRTVQQKSLLPVFASFASSKVLIRTYLFAQSLQGPLGRGNYERAEFIKAGQTETIE